MENVHSIDVEDDQFAYRYDTQLLIDRRDDDLDKDQDFRLHLRAS